MRYSSIRKIDITNGPGVRVSLFTQGCDIHCKGCFNSEIWDFNGGKLFDEDVKNLLFKLCNKPQIAGLSILGGEPLSIVNIYALKELIAEFKSRFPNKSVWLWTGYKFENLTEEQLIVAKLCDVIVDGPWKEEFGDFSLKYRGSSNQRVIDIKETIRCNKIIEYKG